MIAWLSRDSQAYSYDGTVQISTMSGGFFTSYKIVWDPNEFITYGQVQEFLIRRDFTDIAS